MAKKKKNIEAEVTAVEVIAQPVEEEKEVNQESESNNELAEATEEKLENVNGESAEEEVKSLVDLYYYLLQNYVLLL